MVYADDHVANKDFEKDKTNEEILVEVSRCQKAVHTWGKANGVTFEGSKEHLRILCRLDPHGSAVRQLGVLFDMRMSMRDAVTQTAAEARWKVLVLLRCRSRISVQHPISLYKAKVLILFRV